jgi:Flp pilus assembly protein TadG
MSKPAFSQPGRQVQRGTALVEFALVAPLLVVMLFGTIEMGRVLHSVVLVTNAAREGARRGSVGENDGQIRTTVANYLQAEGLQPGQLTTAISRNTVAGRPEINVTLTYAQDLVVPTLHLVPNPLPINATTVMRIE